MRKKIIFTVMIFLYYLGSSLFLHLFMTFKSFKIENCPSPQPRQYQAMPWIALTCFEVICVVCWDRRWRQIITEVILQYLEIFTDALFASLSKWLK